MVIQLKDKLNKIIRKLVLVDNSNELLICDEHGERIAIVTIGDMCIGGYPESKEPHEKNFFLTFTPAKKMNAIDHNGCSVAIYPE